MSPMLAEHSLKAAQICFNSRARHSTGRKQENVTSALPRAAPRTAEGFVFAWEWIPPGWILLLAMHILSEMYL